MGVTPLTRNQTREVDRIAIEQLGIPGVVLMENAGRGAALAIIDELTSRRGHRSDTASVAVVCGGGNNGGDGYVVARHLHNAGALVTIFAAVPIEKLTGDALINARVCVNIGMPIVPITTADELARHRGDWRQYDAIIDALLGTGFAGEVRPHVASIIGECNAAHAAGVLVVAMDLPSGLDCDTGRPSNATVHADVTTTFVAPKAGFSAAEARECIGRVVIVPIGVPPSVIERARRAK